jgi:hypothetical protein
MELTAEEKRAPHKRQNTCFMNPKFPEQEFLDLIYEKSL